MARGKNFQNEICHACLCDKLIFRRLFFDLTEQQSIHHDDENELWHFVWQTKQWAIGLWNLRKNIYFSKIFYFKIKQIIRTFELLCIVSRFVITRREWDEILNFFRCDFFCWNLAYTLDLMTLMSYYAT